MMRLTVLALLGLCANAVMFYLKQGEEVCMSEDTLRGETIMGEFSVSPEQARISATVTDPQKAVVFSKSSASEGKFAFTSPRNGDYRACFTNSGLHQKTVTFEFKKGVHAKDYSSIAKKDSLKPMEVELKRLEDMVMEVHDELKFMQRRNKLMEETNESTHSRVMWSSLWSILLLVGLGVGQLVYLHNYFVKKNVIKSSKD